MEKLSLKLTISETTLDKELAWKDKAFNDVTQAEREKRDAINRADNVHVRYNERYYMYFSNGVYLLKCTFQGSTVEHEFNHLFCSVHCDVIKSMFNCVS